MNVEEGSKIFSDFERATDVLKADVDAAALEVSKSGNQYHRRVLVRACLAWIEFEIYHLKQLAFIFSATGKPVFNIGELANLREEQYSLKSDGSVEAQQKFLRLRENFRFAFEMFARATHSPYKLDVGGIAWSEFLVTIEIRNRITHPKTSIDLDISDEEVAVLNRTYMWFRKICSGLLSSVDEKKVMGEFFSA